MASQRVMMVEVDDDADTYRRYAPELMRYATALVGPNDAGDVVSEAVIAAFNASTWLHVVDRRAYLYRAVLSRAQMAGRSRERRARRDRVSALPLRVVPSEPSIDAQRALSVLSPQQRAVVYLTYWDDLTPGQIATRLDISDGTVRKQLARARAQLRKVFENER